MGYAMNLFTKDILTKANINALYNTAISNAFYYLTSQNTDCELQRDTKNNDLYCIVIHDTTRTLYVRLDITDFTQHVLSDHSASCSIIDVEDLRDCIDTALEYQTIKQAIDDYQL